MEKVPVTGVSWWQPEWNKCRGGSKIRNPGFETIVRSDHLTVVEFIWLALFFALLARNGINLKSSHSEVTDSNPLNPLRLVWRLISYYW